MDIQKIEKRRESRANCEEYTNFNTLVDSVRWMFSPNAQMIKTQSEKGAKINKRRVSDVGILMKSDYTAGVLSEMITSGELWFAYDVTGADENETAGAEYVTKRVYDGLNNSNFAIQAHSTIDSSCSDGTVCSYVERDADGLQFFTVPFGNFWFIEDFRGRPDIVWVEKTTTVGALVKEYGLEKVSEKCKAAFEKTPDEEIKIIYYCAPRPGRDETKTDVMNKPYAVIAYEKESKHQLSEGGADLQKFIVYRVKKIGTETLGRCPCMDTVCSMAAIEQAEKDIQREATLKTKPMFAIPASQGNNSYQIIHEEDASFMLWNDTGMGNPPTQMLSGADLKTGLEYLNYKSATMRGMFYLDYFNPLDNRRNMTLGETKERVQKGHQMIDSIVGPLVQELFNPILKWCLILLGEAGAFSELGTWEEIIKATQGRVSIRYTSRLANAQKRIRLMASLEALQYSMAVAQGISDPVMQYEFLARFKMDAIPDEIISGTNAPKTLLRSIDEARAMSQKFAKQLAEQQKMENSVKMADAASKGGTAPEQGSLTALALGGQ